MVFTKRLREGVRRGEITCSVRMWTRPHVKVGGRYKMEEGEIEVDSIEPIGLPDITPELARASGFLGVVDLLKVANHGRGSNIYLVRFHYVRPRRKNLNDSTPGASGGKGAYPLWTNRTHHSYALSGGRSRAIAASSHPQAATGMNIASP